MSVKLTIKRSRFIKALEEKYSEEELNKIIFSAANDIRNEIIQSLAASKSGRVYTKANGVEHRASAAGEPPATDTGKLKSSIVAKEENLRATVEANTEYAKRLEYGDTTMAARPFMHPAAEKQRPKIRAKLKRLAKEALKKVNNDG